MRSNRRCTRIFILSFLTLSVFVPLVLLSHRLKHLKSDVSKGFVEDLSIIKHRTEAQALSAIGEDEGELSKEPLREVFKDVGFIAINEDNSSVSGKAEDFNLSSRNGTSNGKGDQFNRKVGNSHTLQGEKQLVTVKKEQTRPTMEAKKKQGSHRPDEKIKEIKDQIIRGKMYQKVIPSGSHSQLAKELRLRVKELERILGSLSKDSNLPRRAATKMKAMDVTLAKANLLYPDCEVMSNKLRAMTYNSEEQVRAHKDQTTYLFQLAGRSTPKGLHCLSMRLTSEFFSLLPDDRELPNQHKLNDPSLYHFAVFSDNVLACAVVVNSTVSAAQEPGKIVFHIVTDPLNLPAITMWFLLNTPEMVTVHVQSIDNFGWLSVKYEGRLTKAASLDLRFTSPLNHLRFYLPDVFPRLNKIVFLDHDVVVQRDLKELWEVNMKGKVVGAVETCHGAVSSYRQMDMFINFTDPRIAERFDADTCTWAFGVNIFDLQEWRKQDLTQVYHKFLAMGSRRPMMKAGTLPIGWMTFYKRTVALDRKFHALGLGYDLNIRPEEIEQASVIHFDGILKPWLDIAFDAYKQYWRKYVNYEHPYLQQCNLHV